MTILAPFQPRPGSTVTGTAGASQNVAIDGASKNILVCNFGAAVMFVRIKNNLDTSPATVADCPILPNTYLVLSKMGATGPDAQDTVAIFGTGGTFYITSGEGWG